MLTAGSKTLRAGWQTLLVLAVLASIGTSNPEPSNRSRLKSRARSIVSLLVRDDANGLELQVGPSRASDLRSRWAEATGELGAFHSIASVTSHYTPGHQRTEVSVTCRFDSALITVGTMFDRSGLISGVTFDRSSGQPPSL